MSSYIPHKSSSVPTGRRVILVVGMHRSGTSLTSRILNLLGATAPAHLLPPAEDNPMGYWESQQIARFNERLLRSAGRTWRSELPVPKEWFEHPARESDKRQALELLANEYGDADLLLLKCPRMSRLLPFWIGVLKEANVSIQLVLMARDAVDVAKSLAARAASTKYSTSGIAAPERAALLWLGYLLDAEFYSRELPRIIVDYQQVLSDWRSVFNRENLPMLPAISPAAAAAIDDLFRPEMRRQKGPDDLHFSSEITWRPVLNGFKDSLLTAANGRERQFDQLRQEFAERISLYSPLIETAGWHSAFNPWAKLVLWELHSGSSARLSLDLVESFKAAQDKAHAAALQAALENERAQAAALQAALEKERAQAAALQAALEKERAHAAALQAALEKERAHAAALQAALEKERAHAAALQAALEKERAQAAALHTALQKQRDKAATTQKVLQLLRSENKHLAKIRRSAIDWQRRSWFKRAFHRWRPPAEPQPDKQ